jgi:hypothetical protein
MSLASAGTLPEIVEHSDKNIKSELPIEQSQTILHDNNSQSNIDECNTEYKLTFSPWKRPRKLPTPGMGR